ncbi:MAG: ester cyclase [bacterium]
MTDTIADASRRRALVEVHYAVENRHDLGAIMQTFAARGVMRYNHVPFTDAASISAAHAYMGFSAAGAFAALRTVIDHHHLTTDEIVIEGRLSGRHVGEFRGFAASGRDVELPFVAFYRFDGDGKLASERVVMNLGPLAQTGD